MRARWLTAATAGAALFAAGSAARAEDCGALARSRLDGATVASAEVVAAGPMSMSPGGGLPASPVLLPAFCRVKGVAATSIGFEVWLPQAGWNGRLLSVGNGGFAGAQPLAALADGLAKGYAVTGNDAGHQGEDRAWMRDREKVRYWGHSATHLVTGPAKALVADFYGEPARFSYFAGCSTGGAQAMEEAEFFPADYDGIAAGAPGMSYARLMLSFLWGLKAADRPGAALPLDKLQVLHAAVTAACDGQDGLKDGLLSNPPACRFDPSTLRCPDGTDGARCLSDAQLETVRLIYQGPRNPRTGAQIYPGFAFGSEADPASQAQSPFAYGWLGIEGPLARMFAIPLLRDMVYRDPRWDWRRFDWDKDVADLDRRVGADITAVDPDLSAFQAHGGKLLMYQGWGDPLNAQTLPVEYRAQVIAVFAGQGGRRRAERTVDGFFRLFMAPGMAHCAGGPGPSRFDPVAPLRAWVENGQAPDRIIAERVGAMVPAPAAAEGSPPTPPAPPLSRPLCAYPRYARYQGGAPGEASSFTCVRP